jgi:hypothetical protein
MSAQTRRVVAIRTVLVASKDGPRADTAANRRRAGRSTTRNVLAIGQTTENGLLTLVGTRPTALAEKDRRRNSLRSAPGPTAKSTVGHAIERTTRLPRQYAQS